MNLRSDSMSIIDNSKIESIEEITSPIDLINKVGGIDNNIVNYITQARDIIRNIVNLNDDRLLVITGPCSIHNSKEALAIAENLKLMQQQNPHLYIVMRTYFEKPRTTIGWKGLINDPQLDNSCDINEGLLKARKLLIDINKMNIPTAVEFLDTITPQYIADLVSWGAIGARTTESQEHRKLVSGLSMPVGFKNGTNGNIQIAIDGVNSSKKGHTFLSTTKQGKTAKVTTKGAPNSHIILRGGDKITNYDEKSIGETIKKAEENGINTGIIIDFSHANSLKDYKNQPKVCLDVAKQIADGNKKIVGVMIEANINEGSQKYTAGKDNRDNLIAGTSITDSCVDLKTNEEMLKQLNQAVEKRIQK